MDDKLRHRRHRAKDELPAGAPIIGPDAEERAARRAAKSRRLRKLRRKIG